MILDRKNSEPSTKLHLKLNVLLYQESIIWFYKNHKSNLNMS